MAYFRRAGGGVPEEDWFGIGDFLKLLKS